jgi:hypothetical protein
VDVRNDGYFHNLYSYWLQKRKKGSDSIEATTQLNYDTGGNAIITAG